MTLKIRVLRSLTRSFIFFVIQSTSDDDMIFHFHGLLTQKFLKGFYSHRTFRHASSREVTPCPGLLIWTGVVLIIAILGANQQKQNLLKKLFQICCHSKGYSGQNFLEIPKGCDVVYFSEKFQLEKLKQRVLVFFSFGIFLIFPVRILMNSYLNFPVEFLQELQLILTHPTIVSPVKMEYG